jgi:hypothetical protein
MRMLGCVSPPTGGELTIPGTGPRRNGPDLAGRAAYLLILGLVGLVVSGRRIARLLLT